MTPSYQRVSDSEWRWEDAGRNRSLRLFASTRRLIWSAWVDSLEGPVYEDGLAQTYEVFLAEGPPSGVGLPQALDQEIHATLAGLSKTKRRRLFCNG